MGFMKASSNCLSYVLDRTADVDITKYYLPRVELLASGTPITPHATFVQIPSYRFSKTKLETNPGIVSEIMDFVLAKSRGELTLVITHKSIEKQFHGYEHIRRCTTVRWPVRTDSAMSGTCSCWDSKILGRRTHYGLQCV